MINVLIIPGGESTGFMNALYNATSPVPAKKKKRTNSKEQKVNSRFY